MAGHSRSSPPPQRFGDAAARVIFSGNWVGEALDARCQACPPRHKTHSFTANALRVEVFPNPNAEFRAYVPNMMESGQPKEAPVNPLTDCE
jgi:hypothetical protein